MADAAELRSTIPPASERSAVRHAIWRCRVEKLGFFCLTIPALRAAAFGAFQRVDGRTYAPLCFRQYSEGCKESEVLQKRS